MVTISLDRYYVILHPFKPKLRIKQSYIILILIWIVSIALSSMKLYNYHSYFNTNIGKKICEPFNEYLNKYETIFLVLLQYIIPFFIIICTYFRIILHIYMDDCPNSVTNNQKKNKKKVGSFQEISFIISNIFLDLNIFH